MLNEDTIKKRIAALESDIKVMTNTIQELDAKKQEAIANLNALHGACLLYTSPSPRDLQGSRMPSSA